MYKTFGEKIPEQVYIRREGVYGIVIDYKDKVAVIRLHDDACFLAGGGIELGESHEEALKREFLEETGFDIQIGQYIDGYIEYDCSLKDGNYYELVGHVYYVNLLDHIVEKVEEDHELVWINSSEAKELLFLNYQGYAIEQALKI